MIDGMTRKSKTEQVAKSVRTLMGGLVLLLGVVAIPYPGPGWLIVFTGLAILARDYPFAQRILDRARHRYNVWQEWLDGKSWYVRTVVWIITALIVIVTIWLLNGYGLLNSFFSLNWEWLNSPFL